MNKMKYYRTLTTPYWRKAQRGRKKSKFALTA